MLKWALVFAIVSIIAGVLGFTGVAASAAGISKILFFIFLAMFFAVVIFSIFAAKKLGPK